MIMIELTEKQKIAIEDCYIAITCYIPMKDGDTQLYRDDRGKIANKSNILKLRYSEYRLDDKGNAPESGLHEWGNFLLNAKSLYLKVEINEVNHRKPNFATKPSVIIGQDPTIVQKPPTWENVTEEYKPFLQQDIDKAMAGVKVKKTYEDNKMEALEAQNRALNEKLDKLLNSMGQNAGVVKDDESSTQDENDKKQRMDELRQQYQDLSGEKASGRWSEKTLQAKIDEL